MCALSIAKRLIKEGVITEAELKELIAERVDVTKTRWRERKEVAAEKDADMR